MRVAFRVDASREIGSGHLLRCLTLADALKQKGAETRFVTRGLSERLCALVGTRGHDLVEIPRATSASAGDDLRHSRWLGTSQAADARDTIGALADQSWDVLVVDHYALDERWESALRGTATHTLVIDDIADRAHDCDLLLDQNLYADQESRYRGKVPARCRLLLGPRFALLREEFRVWRERVQPRTGPVERVLVSFGGVDADNHTARALAALAGIGALAVDVVIGAEHADREGVETACAASGYACHVQTQRMAELMAAADLAIGAGGVTTWERCCVGVPALALVVAENQKTQIRDAAAAGLVSAPDVPREAMTAALIGRHASALMESPGMRYAMSRRGMEALDGRGTSRVVREIGGTDIVIREAGSDDSAQLFAWRNHPAIRAVSRTQEVLDWQGHQRWLAAVLADPQRILVIGQRNGIALGVVRFDIQGDEAEVSIYLAPGTDAPGTGSQLLHVAERWLASSRPDVRGCRATVLGANVPSHRLFAGAGYEVQSTWYSKRLIPDDRPPQDCG